MVFIESAVFIAQVQSLLTDESYAARELHLAANPSAGDVTRSNCGLRKMRRAVSGRGKSGGVRVIYFHVSAQGQCRMLLTSREGVNDDLSSVERKALRRLNEH
jgi:hypothetical protein